MPNIPNLNFSRSLLSEKQFEKIFLKFLDNYANGFGYDEMINAKSFEIDGQMRGTKLNAFEFVKKDEEFELKAKIKDQFLNALFIEKENLLTQIQEEILTNEKGLNKYLTLILDEHKHILEELKVKNWLVDFDYILIDIKDRIAYFSDKYRVDHLKNQSSVMENKIIWTSNLSTLVTLFKDLQSNIKSSKNDNYIKASDDDLIKFIHSNFVDSEKQQFELETIRRSLSKPAKRDKIDVTELLQKTVPK